MLKTKTGCMKAWDVKVSARQGKAPQVSKLLLTTSAG
jgi:hypothetical protein